MNFLITAGVALLGTLASVIGIYNYLPLDLLQFSRPEPLLGSTITTIAGTDTLSSSRTTINDNFSALNSTKIENSTTSVAAIITLANLSTVGTITSGTWSGTAIAVAKGGTGTTTPTTNQVILGDSTNGFKVVTGFGTSGFFLTSNGAAAAPTWQSSAIDQGANYTWTGLHLFQASTTLTATTSISASNALSKALILNQVPYSFPSTQGASSTVWTNNGSGRLTSEILPWVKIGETQFAGAATTTLTLTSTTTAQDLKVVVRGVISGNTCRVLMRLNPNTTTGQGANYAWTLKPNNDAAVTGGTNDSARIVLDAGNNQQFGVNMELSNDVSLKKVMTWMGFGGNSSLFWGANEWNDTTEQLKSISVGLGGCASGGTMTSGRITVYASQN